MPASVLSSVSRVLDEGRIHQYPVDEVLLGTVMSHYAPGSEFKDIAVGPSLVTYLFSVPVGTNGSALSKRESDIARDIGVKSLRVNPGVVPGLFGIEVPNNVPEPVRFRDVYEHLSTRDRGVLEVVLGKDTIGEPMTLDLGRMPHLLVAGTTGSGKSVFLNSVLSSLIALNRKEDVNLLLVDPKQVEFDAYRDVPHLGMPIANTLEDALEVLGYAIREMENRLSVLRRAGVKDISELPASRRGSFPYLVIVIDEFADLMLSGSGSRDFEEMVVRLAQKSRAAGIHMVIATQKPVVKVVTGLIKGNMPARISFRVPSASDSRVILDSNGAESLLGRGDMLISTSEHDMKRAQGAWISDSDIKAVIRAAIVSGKE